MSALMAAPSATPYMSAHAPGAVDMTGRIAWPAPPARRAQAPMPRRGMTPAVVNRSLCRSPAPLRVAAKVQSFRPMAVVYSPQQACVGCCRPGAVNMKVIWRQPRQSVNCAPPPAPVLSRTAFASAPTHAAPPLAVFAGTVTGGPSVFVRHVSDGVAPVVNVQAPAMPTKQYALQPVFVRHVSPGAAQTRGSRTDDMLSRKSMSMEGPIASAPSGFVRHYSEGDADDYARIQGAAAGEDHDAFATPLEPSAPTAAEAEPLDGGDIVVLSLSQEVCPIDETPVAAAAKPLDGGAEVFSPASEGSTSFASASKGSGSSTPTMPEFSSDCGHAHLHEEASAVEPETPTATSEVGLPQLGDIVLLGAAVPEECRFHAAVVTNLCKSHCTAIVLDEELCHGIGECWPSYSDVTVKDTLLRLGTRVVVHGMHGARTKCMNGSTGIVSAHPTRGHPTFVSKPNNPEQAQLTVCVVFDEPAAVGKKSALVEPRFLRPYSDAVKMVSSSLSGIAADITAASGTSPDAKVEEPESLKVTRSTQKERTSALVEALAMFAGV